jgi:hypothetical protein
LITHFESSRPFMSYNLFRPGATQGLSGFLYDATLYRRLFPRLWRISLKIAIFRQEY